VKRLFSLTVEFSTHPTPDDRHWCGCAHGHKKSGPEPGPPNCLV